MFNNLSVRKGPMYDPAAVQPMRDELTSTGFEELLTVEQVDAAVRDTNGLLLVMVNSVCGCAAGSARPAVALALQHGVIPDRMVTVFAGQERDATDRMRSYFKDIPPSSPSIALLRGGKLEFMLQRHDIEGRSAEEIAADLREMFDTLATRKGPAISPEEYAERENVQACGSRIPRMN